MCEEKKHRSSDAEAHSLAVQRLKQCQRPLSTSILVLCLFLSVGYNGFRIFYVKLPFLADAQVGDSNKSPENAAGGTQAKTKWSSSSAKLSSSSLLYAVKEEQPPVIRKIRLPPLKKLESSDLPVKDSSLNTPRGVPKRDSVLKILRPGNRSRWFSGRVKEFFGDSSCKFRFFMTWISSLESFGEREFFTVESMFKSHPNACLVIVSNSLDSSGGTQLLNPFGEKGFRVIAVSPDFDYIFKNTMGEVWFNRLKKRKINPGEISLGQNLSNLLRLALLYKFGGIYMDTDFVVLKSFSGLRNVIGAQTMDLATGNWSRLNNAVMIFDEQHPLLLKFIEEFALTFNGNKWGHNGPYLVSRVVSKISGRTGFNFTVLPPPAFYPVDWSKIPSFFKGPRDKPHSKWLAGKLLHVRMQSFAVHLWNRHSNNLKVEKGSIMDHLVSDSCVFCNSSVSAL